MGQDMGGGATGAGPSGGRRYSESSGRLPGGAEHGVPGGDHTLLLLLRGPPGAPGGPLAAGTSESEVTPCPCPAPSGPTSPAHQEEAATEGVTECRVDSRPQSLWGKAFMFSYIEKWV